MVEAVPNESIITKMQRSYGSKKGKSLVASIGGKIGEALSSKREVKDGSATDRALSKKYGTTSMTDDPHSVNKNGKLKGSVYIKGDKNNPSEITITDGKSGNTYVYKRINSLKHIPNLSRKYGDRDYILVDARNPEGKDIRNHEHHEVYHLDEKDIYYKQEYNLTQPEGYDGSGKSSINIRS